MLRYAGRHGAALSDLSRLFKGPDSEPNTKALLELELETIEGGDPYLRKDIERAIRDLHPRPVDALKKLRAFGEEVLKEVLNAEFPDGKVSGDLARSWHYSGTNHSRSVVRSIYPTIADGQHPAGEDCDLPSGDGSHNDCCRLLDLLTDSNQKGTARYISNGTVRLMQVLRSMGNYGVHSDDIGEVVPFSTAASMCFVGVELFRRLPKELPVSS